VLLVGGAHAASACPRGKLYIRPARIDRSLDRPPDASADAASLLDDRGRVRHRTGRGRELPPDSGVNLTL